MSKVIKRKQAAIKVGDFCVTVANQACTVNRKIGKDIIVEFYPSKMKAAVQKKDLLVFTEDEDKFKKFSNLKLTHSIEDVKKTYLQQLSVYLLHELNELVKAAQTDQARDTVLQIATGIHDMLEGDEMTADEMAKCYLDSLQSVLPENQTKEGAE